jgi:hypothetical protein
MPWGVGVMMTVVLFSGLLLVAGWVFYNEQVNPPKDVTDLPAPLFLMGLVVRLTLTFVVFTLSAILLSALWFSA